MDHESERPNDIKKLLSLANSDTGQQLLNMLKKNCADSLNSAIQQAQNGDITQAKEIVRQILENPDAAELIQRLRGSL